MSTPMKLVIADDHPLLLDGLKNVLNEIKGIEVVGVAVNGNDLIAFVRKSRIDMVLIDLQMPRIDGIEALKIIRNEFPGVKIIVFTNYNQPKLIKEVKALGANGYLLKNSSSILLKEAVVAVASGQNWFRQMESEKEPLTFMPDDFMKKYKLTVRETEIIGKISKGLTTKEIARELYVSEFTVSTHRRNICKKLNIYTPVGLLQFARQYGLA